MLRPIFDFFPIWSFWLFFTVLFLALTLLVYRLFARYFPPYIADKNLQARIVSTMIMIVVGFYGILFGLVIVNLWQNFHRVQDLVSRQATDLSSIAIESRIFPLTARMKIQSSVRAYALSVIHTEWRHMRQEPPDSETWEALWKIFSTLNAISPSTPIENIYYTEMLSKVEDTLGARRELLDSLRTSMPAFIYLILLVGALLVIIAIALLTVLAGSYLLFMSIAIACFIALNLTVVIDLDTVFKGGLVVTNAPFYSVLAQLS